MVVFPAGIAQICDFDFEAFGEARGGIVEGYLVLEVLEELLDRFLRLALLLLLCKLLQLLRLSPLFLLLRHHLQLLLPLLLKLLYLLLQVFVMVCGYLLPIQLVAQLCNP